MDSSTTSSSTPPHPTFFSIFQDVQKFSVALPNDDNAVRTMKLLNKLARCHGLHGVFTQNSTVRPGVDFFKMADFHHLKLDKLIEEIEDQKTAMNTAFSMSLAPEVPNPTTSAQQSHIAARKKRHYRHALRVNERAQYLHTAVEDPLSICLSLYRTALEHITSAEQLGQLAGTLCSVDEFAFDFELTCALYGHHPIPRVCLLQISTHAADFLVDILEPDVRWNMHILSAAFADERIQKVCHGAQERAFLRQVGIERAKPLFDTSGDGKRNLCALVFEACGVRLDKSQRTANWTLRPLTQQMVDYARLDTHYLLRCYHYLKKGGGL
uniref:3'-5' exonuclease domain-containing protein n=1 Tax=Globodera pallida TaxID=36090 RepID=A0A183BHU4_GLOPA